MRAESTKTVIGSVAIGLVSGSLLAVLNLMFAQETLVLQFNFPVVFAALSPAIFEEIALRAFLFGISFVFCKRKGI